MMTCREVARMNLLNSMVDKRSYLWWLRWIEDVRHWWR